MPNDCAVSVVVPLYNEEGNLQPIYQKIKEAMTEYGDAHEVIFMNDGSTDSSEAILNAIATKDPRVTVVSLYRNKGKAAALEIGFSLAQGTFISNIDCDLQYDCNDIPRLVKILEQGWDVASARRTSREDSKSTVVTSLVFNWLMKRITRLNFKDYFSGLKCYRKSVVRYLALYGDLYRFAPVYAFRQAFRVIEVPVSHSQRHQGKSKYNFLSRLRMALADILTALFTVTFNQDRVYYMGAIGLGILSIGSFLFFFSHFISGSRLAGETFALTNFSYLFLYLGVQILILKKFSLDFFSRHEDEREKRRRNIKSIIGLRQPD